MARPARSSSFREYPAGRPGPGVGVGEALAGKQIRPAGQPQGLPLGRYLH